MASQDLTAARLANNNRIQAHDAVTAEQCATGNVLAHLDDLGLSSDGQRMSTILAPHSARGTQPRDNFPLPRELRDQQVSG
jgi:hypothetical protein